MNTNSVLGIGHLSNFLRRIKSVHLSVAMRSSPHEKKEKRKSKVRDGKRREKVRSGKRLGEEGRRGKRRPGFGRARVGGVRTFSFPLVPQEGKGEKREKGETGE